MTEARRIISRYISRTDVLVTCDGRSGAVSERLGRGVIFRAPAADTPLKRGKAHDRAPSKDHRRSSVHHSPSRFRLLALTWRISTSARTRRCDGSALSSGDIKARHLFRRGFNLGYLGVIAPRRNRIRNHGWDSKRMISRRDRLAECTKSDPRLLSDNAVRNKRAKETCDREIISF
jgi:hypothetical protein